MSNGNLPVFGTPNQLQTYRNTIDGHVVDSEAVTLTTPDGEPISDTNRLPVDIGGGGGGLPLPANASEESGGNLEAAAQALATLLTTVATETTLSGISTDTLQLVTLITSLLARTNSLGQKAASGSMPVVLASDQPAITVMTLDASLTLAGGDSLAGVADTAATITYTLTGDDRVDATGVVTSGVLAQGQLPNAAADLLPANSGHTRFVRALRLVNTNPGLAEPFTLYANGTAAANELAHASLPAGGMGVLDGDGWKFYDANGAIQ